MNVDPGVAWKGPWRWYSEEMLRCCESLELVKKRGIIFDRFICLAQCNGAEVKSKYGSETTEEEFRSLIKQACSSSDSRLVVSYSRKEFKQTGDGHFSPVGGFNNDNDMVLLLDVARFKYPPHWVPLPLLWRSLQRLDAETGRSRGWVQLWPSSIRVPPVFFVVAGGMDMSWRELTAFLRTPLPFPTVSVSAQESGCGNCGGCECACVSSLVPDAKRQKIAAGTSSSSSSSSTSSSSSPDVLSMVAQLLHALPLSTHSMLTSLTDRYQVHEADLSPQDQEIVAKLLASVRSLPIFDTVSSLLCSTDLCIVVDEKCNKGLRPEILTVLLLLLLEFPQCALWDAYPNKGETLKAFCRLESLPQCLADELVRVKNQLGVMVKWACSGTECTDCI